MADQKKYLDLTGLELFKANLEEELAPSTPSLSANLYKVSTDAKGIITVGEAVTLEDKNQTVQVGSTTFDPNAAVKFVGGTNISVTGNATTNEITIATSGTAANQTVKGNGTAFVNDAVVDIKPATVSASSLTVATPITISAETGTTPSISVGHGTTTRVAPAAVKIGNDEYGHVIVGGAIQYSDIENTPVIPTVNDAALTIQVNGNSKGSFSANAATATTINLTAADFGLDTPLNFVGVSTTDPKGSSGATVAGHTSWNKGEVVLYGNKEYVLTGTDNVAADWTELGDEGSYALKTITVTGTNGLTGGGDLSQNRTISHATVSGGSFTAGAYQIGSDEYGHVVKGNALGVSGAGTHTHTVTGSVTVPTVSSTSGTLAVSTGSTAVVTGVSSGDALFKVTYDENDNSISFAEVSFATTNVLTSASLTEAASGVGFIKTVTVGSTTAALTDGATAANEGTHTHTIA